MQFNKPFRLAPVFRTETATAEDENHGMLPLQFGEFPVFRRVVGKLIVREHSPTEPCLIAYEILNCRSVTANTVAIRVRTASATPIPGSRCRN